MLAPKNMIPSRIADALLRFPPFSMLPHSDVAVLAAEANVSVVPMGDFVWRQGAHPGEEVLVVAQGRVEYIWDNEGRTERVDVRDVGDVLGLSALVRNEPFQVSAQAVEDCILYGLSWPKFRVLLEQNDEARNYVRRHLFWAVRVGRQIESEPTQSGITGRAKNILQAHLDGAQLIQPRPIERLLICGENATLSEAAALISAKRVPSILVVDSERRPLGIVSSNTLVKHVIVDNMAKSTPVSKIMARPVCTVSPNSSATAAMLVMLRERIGQVCVTEDGTPNTKALDVCTHKDLLAQSGHHPAGLLREIRFAKSTARFRELCDEIETITRSYLDSGISAIYLGQICAELYDELTQRMITLATDELHDDGISLPRGVAWAWMSVGSDGRREQILRTDMDNAIVFSPTGSPEDDEAARKIFTLLASHVIEKLVAAGFARCQGGVMAMNPRWCRTTKEWIDEINSFNAQTDGDGLLRATVLYDLRHVSGDRILCDTLRERVYATVSADTALQRRLAELIVDNTPPLNFIGRFVVEKLGGGGGEFDLKARGMAPLRDAARLFSLHHKLNRRYSTGGRWDELRRVVPQRAELAVLARDAYDFLLGLRTTNGLRRGDSGRYLDPAALTKIERAQLASVFDVVRTVQHAVQFQFDVDRRLT